MKDHVPDGEIPVKFQNPDLTAAGEARAKVQLRSLETLWFNSGTLCNITCANCYIESSPTNDQLVYLETAEVENFLDEAENEHPDLTEIGFTGGEPFMNPNILEMAGLSLARGFEVLILTNAMRPMMRKSVRAGLKKLAERYGNKLTLRVSLDHFTRNAHDQERGEGTFDITLKGMAWLRDAGVKMTVAGRTIFGDDDETTRRGYAELFAKHDFDIDADNPSTLVLFPEMDLRVEVPEITTACWSILDKSPNDVMCSNARMVVKRKGADRPVVLACTLLAYEPEFELGATLAESTGDVALNHPHCAKFCVLGGASCSA